MLSLFCNASNDKISKKLEAEINKSDLIIPFELKSSHDFWDYVQKHNKTYTEYIRKRSKGIRRLREEFTRMASEKEISVADMDSLEIYLVDFLDGPDRTVKCISLYDDVIPNAYVSPNGVINISTGIVDLLNWNELLSVLAHEVAHFKLKHAEVNYISYKKREKKNNMLAAIAGSLASSGALYASAVSGTDDHSAAFGAVKTIGESSEAIAKREAIMFYYKYSREQEIEADILAYRFMEFKSVGGNHLLTALSKLENFMSKMGMDVNKKSSEDSHPTFEYRKRIISILIEREWR